MILRYLLEKEFKQIFRDSFLPRLILLFPCMIILVMPWAATMEVENVKIAVVDNDHSMISERLVQRIEASPYFCLTATPASYDKALEKVEADQADIILEIPRGLEKNMVNGTAASVLIAANAVNGTKGSLGSSYLQQILSPQVSDVSIRYLFNPYLDYKVFMIPAMMTMVLVMLCGFLPALNIVGEKEKGTIEQMNVTPVSRFNFTLAKLLPYWMIGFIALTLCMLLAWLVYGLSPAGNVLCIYGAMVIFIFVVSGLGLTISNYSATMQQAMFVMWFCMLVFILMSGLFTPISSMPEWAQYITYVNPLRYFMEIMRMIYLKGSGVIDILPQVIILSGFAVVLYTWAIVSYKKQA